MSKLKRCPCCSGECKLVDDEYSYIYCLKCKMKFDSYAETTEELIKEFNTRKPMDRIVERLEELHPDKECFEFEDDYIYAEERHNKYIKIIKGEGVKDA